MGRVNLLGNSGGVPLSGIVRSWRSPCFPVSCTLQYVTLAKGEAPLPGRSWSWTGSIGTRAPNKPFLVQDNSLRYLLTGTLCCRINVHTYTPIHFHTHITHTVTHMLVCILRALTVFSHNPHTNTLTQSSCTPRHSLRQHTLTHSHIHTYALTHTSALIHICMCAAPSWTHPFLFCSQLQNFPVIVSFSLKIDNLAWRVNQMISHHSRLLPYSEGYLLP